MPVAEAGGLRFHTQVLGDGPPVALLHGLLIGSLAAWYFTAAPVLAAKHRVLLYDLRGHGKSDRPLTGYDVNTMAGDLGALLDAFDPRPVALVGHSYGALVALRFALDHPERVTKLAIVEAPLPPSTFSDLTAKTPEELLAILPGPLAEGVARGGRQARRFLESLDFLLRKSTLVADLAAERDIGEDALAQLECPVLLAYGNASPCLAVGERLVRALPNARLSVLEGGHFLHLDCAAALSTLLSEFLDG